MKEDHLKEYFAKRKRELVERLAALPPDVSALLDKVLDEAGCGCCRGDNFMDALLDLAERRQR